MKVISIRQPWVWAIFHPILKKDVENRTWKTNFTGEILIHASKTFDEKGEAFIKNEFGIRIPKALPLGGIVGKATISACVDTSDSRWFFGPYGFVLENPILTNFIEYKGQVGLFNFSDNSLLKEVI